MIAAATPHKRLQDGVHVRAVPGESGTQYYLTACAEPDRPWAESAARCYAALAALFESEGIEPVQEQVYAAAGIREDLLEIRRRAFRARRIDPALPFAFIDGKPAGGGLWSGVQAWGVGPGPAARPPKVSTVDCPGGLRGRLWSCERFRLLYIPALTGAAAGQSGPSGPPALQAERMFSNALAALDAHGFSYRRVVRTWIYLRRILDWYGDFNKVRNALYRRPDFLGEAGDAAFPASTGIQGRLGDEECAMNVLAFDAPGAAQAGAAPVLRTARQGPAFGYSSAFSRAMALRTGGIRTIYVSGTASIDGAGETVYRGDREGQALQTLLSVAALLDEQGGGLDSICAATLYCADRETYDVYRGMTRLLGLPAFPTIAVRADVCRPELLIELEATAVVPAGVPEAGG